MTNVTFLVGWPFTGRPVSRGREMMSAEFGIRYMGTGWLDIVEDKGIKTSPPMAPDLVVSSRR